jgi:hypothetical protein
MTALPSSPSFRPSIYSQERYASFEAVTDHLVGLGHNGGRLK